MSDQQLTRDADKLLAQLYKSYLEKRKSGVSRDDAIRLGDVDEIASAAPKSNSADIASLCGELKQKGYLDVLFADDTVYYAELRTEAIVVLENRFKNGVAGVLDFLSKFIP